MLVEIRLLIVMKLLTMALFICPPGSFKMSFSEFIVNKIETL